MNCEDCQALISDFVDCDLGAETTAAVEAHMAACEPCTKLCADFAVIADSLKSEPIDEIIPPNSQALWCRINNIIESGPPAATPAKAAAEEKSAPRLRRWNLTFAQTAAAVVGIALISSLLTVVFVRNYFEPGVADNTLRSAATETTFEKFLSKVGLSETPQMARERRVREQQAAIEYWNKRVQEKKAQWDARIREAFDRNLHEIDQAVNEYNNNLTEDPQDELSGEMLDSALTDKMNLLREFADL